MKIQKIPQKYVINSSTKKIEVSSLKNIILLSVIMYILNDLTKISMCHGFNIILVSVLLIFNDLIRDQHNLIIIMFGT